MNAASLPDGNDAERPVHDPRHRGHGGLVDVLEEGRVDPQGRGVRSGLILRAGDGLEADGRGGGVGDGLLPARLHVLEGRGDGQRDGAQAAAQRGVDCDARD